MIELNVCIGSSCHVNGAHNVATSFQHLIEEYDLHDQINFAASFCMRQCGAQGVSVRLNGEAHRIAAESARTWFRENVLPLAGK